MARGGGPASKAIFKGISYRPKSEEAYVKAKIDQKEVICLLDTGCERSAIGRKLIPSYPLTKTQLELVAANDTPIPLIGVTKVLLTIGGKHFEVEVAVSDVLEELILGIDFLAAHNCKWDFGEAKVTIEGLEILLYQRPSRVAIRRVYVKENSVVPPHCEMNIPVKVTRHSLRSAGEDWLLEAKGLRPGVVVARILIADGMLNPAIRIINYTDRPCQVKEGTGVGQARPVVLAEPTGAVQDSPREQVSRNQMWPKEDYLKEVVDSLPGELTQEQHKTAKNLVYANQDIFSRAEFDIGRTHLVQHRIDTGDNRPIKQQLRRHPLAHLPIIDQHVEDMLKNDVVEPAASPWSSNVVLVRKQDGGLRFCIDYRRLNEVTYKDSYPLPRTDSCLQSLGGSHYFSTLDLRSGYWQTALDPRDRDKTAFVTRKGTFRFKVLSFGLANAPGLFQRLMDLVLTGLTWETCLVYLDDVIVFGRTFEEHARRLSEVFARLRDANLKLKPSKCKLFQKKVSFLGHVITEEGISPDPEKIKAVVDWPRPKSLRETRAFIGLASYYRRHIFGFAAIARPLHELTKKGERFHWDTPQEEAFKKLKECLTTAPVLAAPLQEGRYVLDTDSSDFALGAVLQQEQGGILRVIAYVSRALDTAEKNYCTTRKELLAVIYGLKQFRHFLLAQEFTIRTDHAALTYLKRTPEPVGQQSRWLDLLAEFHFTIQHRPGISHGNSDALSRRPCVREIAGSCQQCQYKTRKTCFGNRSKEKSVSQEEIATDVTPEFVLAVGDNPFASDQIRQAQSDDIDISAVLGWMETNDQAPPWTVANQHQEEARILWAQWDSLVCLDHVLYRKFQRADGTVHRYQVVMPKTLRKEFIRHSHEGVTGGHLGIRRTQASVQLRAYWPGWRRCVERHCAHCTNCNRVKKGQAPRQGYLQPMTVGATMDRLHIDLCGPFPVSQGKRWIMTCLDAYTRYLIAVPLKDKTAVTVATALAQEVYCKIGFSRAIISDQGPEFQNEIMQHLCQLLGIQQLRTTSYHPSGNGRVERSHATLNTMMAKVVDDNQKDWVDKLSTCVMAYNISRHEGTSYSPFYLMYGRQAICPLDLLLEIPKEEEAWDIHVYADVLVDRFRQAFQAVTAHSVKQIERMKRNYDYKVKPSEFKPGDLVWYFYPRRYANRAAKWSRHYTGPVRIEAKLNSVNYVIKRTPRSKAIVVHVDKLKKYFGEVPLCWQPDLAEAGGSKGKLQVDRGTPGRSLPNMQTSQLENTCKSRTNGGDKNSSSEKPPVRERRQVRLPARYQC